MQNNEPVMIAYWGDEKDVLFIRMGSDMNTNTVFGGSDSLIFNAMTNRIAYGQITEILEYHPHGADSVHIDERCDYWRAQLRNLGYEFCRDGEGGDYNG